LEVPSLTAEGVVQQLPQPVLRPLKIYPTDPTRGYQAARTATILVENEPLTEGPAGDRLEVVDYDGAEKTFYDQVNLDDPAILMQGGLPPSEADPRFHQQMVYAVASRTLANFDRALGRRISMRKGSRLTRLRLLPHAFRGENAYYDRDLHAILFGYFAADPFQFGTNMPGQTIFTCLSHDIIAHEMTHAIVDRLRRYFLEPSNVDVLAFHEGFADIVALLQHFSYRDILADTIQQQRTDLRQSNGLVELAQQFGYATGNGAALRSALGDKDARLYANIREPHQRGSILVAAVFDGFLTTYQSRIDDLIRIATGGSGVLPPGDLQPDLLSRIATEASRTAQRQLDMCIRAFDYLPPVDITFGDYLRALVTADFELNPEDEWGQRAALIEGFRQRGIYPEEVPSLAEESLRWNPAGPDVPPLTDSLSELLPQLLQIEAQRFTKHSTDPRLASRESGSRPLGDSEEDEKKFVQSIYGRMRSALQNYARLNAVALHLDPALDPYVSGIDATFRTAPNGQLLIELVAQIVQTDVSKADDPDFGGLEVRGGCTLVVGVDGSVRYVIYKPLPNPHLDAPALAKAQARLDDQRAFVAELDRGDPQLAYLSPAQAKTRMKARMSLRALHEGR
jgi:hypothetical protein